MAEGLKPIWQNIPVPTPDLSGNTVASRGTDPNVDESGTSGLTAVPWEGGGKQSPATTAVGTAESSNSSGLPSLPNRFEPTPASPPEPPSLQDRSPGTIDEK